MTYLVGDIGATNARFCLANKDTWQSDPVRLPTAGFGDTASLFEALGGVLDVADIQGAVLAVAGPERQGLYTLTNTGLPFDPQQCTAQLGCPVRLVNDFYAVAAGVPAFTRLKQLGGPENANQPHPLTRAVLGPGSGLGMAILTPIATGWEILSGEGGHAGLSPGTHLESEIWSILAADVGHVSWESVLCGPGLSRLYQAVCQIWGQAAEPLSAADISARGTTMSDLVCHQTLETFAGLLGAAAGDLALTSGAVGGVYIAGGIAPRMSDFLIASPLRRRFEEKGPMQAYMQAIPLFLVQEDEPGLLGARECLQL